MVTDSPLDLVGCMCYNVELNRRRLKRSYYSARNTREREDVGYCCVYTRFPIHLYCLCRLRSDRLSELLLHRRRTSQEVDGGNARAERCPKAQFEL